VSTFDHHRIPRGVSPLERRALLRCPNNGNDVFASYLDVDDYDENEDRARAHGVCHWCGCEFFACFAKQRTSDAEHAAAWGPFIGEWAYSLAGTDARPASYDFTLASPQASSTELDAIARASTIPPGVP
jgi:hypothetical protein